MRLSIRVPVLISLLVAVLPIPAGAVSSNLVISQIYIGTGDSDSCSLSIPVGGKIAKFASELFPSLPSSFQGVVRVTASSAVSVIGLRGRTNERFDFLITTVPPIEEINLGSSAEVVFPHFVDSGGYTTQFILLNGVTGQTSLGTVLFRTIGGQRLDLLVQ